MVSAACRPSPSEAISFPTPVKDKQPQEPWVHLCLQKLGCCAVSQGLITLGSHLALHCRQLRCFSLGRSSQQERLGLKALSPKFSLKALWRQKSGPGWKHMRSSRQTLVFGFYLQGSRKPFPKGKCASGGHILKRQDICLVGLKHIWIWGLKLLLCWEFGFCFVFLFFLKNSPDRHFILCYKGKGEILHGNDPRRMP